MDTIKTLDSIVAEIYSLDPFDAARFASLTAEARTALRQLTTRAAERSSIRVGRANDAIVNVFNRAAKRSSIQWRQTPVVEINAADHDVAARLAAQYALDCIHTSIFADEICNACVAQHFDRLIDAGAKFDYQAAMRIALM